MGGERLQMIPGQLERHHGRRATRVADVRALHVAPAAELGHQMRVETGRHPSRARRGDQEIDVAHLPVGARERGAGRLLAQGQRALAPPRVEVVDGLIGTEASGIDPEIAAIDRAVGKEIATPLVGVARHRDHLRLREAIRGDGGSDCGDLRHKMRTNSEHTARVEPMPLYSFEGKSPVVHPTAFIAPTAVLIGDVTVEENGSVWYNAVLRSDFNPIVVRRGANVQDCAVVHVTPASGVEIGAGATIGHNCTVHACTIGEEAIVGNGSTVLDGARIGTRAMVAAGALVTPGTEIPDGMLAVGAPAKVRGPLAGTPAERWVLMNPTGYQALAQRHKASVTPVA
jgi:carbonic anhydrase/acetyltransferase-like protein (isoleucine patch superfamily)